MNTANLNEARHRLSVLIVCKQASTSSQLRQAFLGVGFSDVKSKSDYNTALDSISEDSPDLVLFDAETPENSSMQAAEFVSGALEAHPSVSLIAVSSEPSGEYLFGLLKGGVRSFLIPPFTSQAIEDAFLQLQSGLEMSDEILQAESRHEAFAKLLVAEQGRVSTLAKANPPTPEQLDNFLASFTEAVRLSRFFCDDDENLLFQTTYQGFIDHADALDREYQQSRLRKTREMLRAKRKRKK